MFNCDKCDRKYQWKVSLTRHQKHDHGDFFQEQENAAKKDFLRKKDAISLSERKVAYSLGDEDLVIRTTDHFKVNAFALSDGQPVFNAFGVSGMDNIVRMFYGILAMLDHHHHVFLTNRCCDPKKFGQLLGACSEQDRVEMRKIIQSNDEEMRTIKINQSTLIQLSPGHIPHPQIGLLKLLENVNGEFNVHTGIYLHPNELMKLIKHLNSIHSISPSIPTSLIYSALRNLSDQELIA